MVDLPVDSVDSLLLVVGLLHEVKKFAEEIRACAQH